MSVRVLTDYGSTVTHDDATDFKTGGADDGTLFLFAKPNDWPIATYARGRWVSAQRIADPEPEPPLLRAGTAVRIPGIDVPYVVDKGLATSGPHATLTFTTVDGRDWFDDRSESVNAVAEPIPDAAKCPSVTLAPKSVNPDAEGESAYQQALAELRARSTPTEAVLSETTEPYVCVSVTANDASGVAQLLRTVVDRDFGGDVRAAAKAFA